MSEEYSAVLPIKNYLGADYDGNYDRKIRQIGEVTYTPHFENEEMRHLKVHLSEIYRKCPKLSSMNKISCRS